MIGGGAYYRSPSLSRCGKWVAFTCEDDIWVASVLEASGGAGGGGDASEGEKERREFLSAAVARRITGGGGGGHGGRSRWPLFSPCGTRLAFTSSASGTHELMYVPFSTELGISTGQAVLVTSGEGDWMLDPVRAVRWEFQAKRNGENGSWNRLVFAAAARSGGSYVWDNVTLFSVDIDTHCRRDRLEEGGRRSGRERGGEERRQRRGSIGVTTVLQAFRQRQQTQQRRGLGQEEAEERIHDGEDMDTICRRSSASVLPRLHSFAQLQDPPLSRLPRPLGVGPADYVAPIANGQGILLGRRTFDAHISEWKHYRGGALGEIWLCGPSHDRFQRLRVVSGGKGKGEMGNRRELRMHISSPMIAGRRLFFVADPDVGEIERVLGPHVAIEGERETSNEEKSMREELWEEDRERNKERTVRVEEVREEVEEDEEGAFYRPYGGSRYYARGNIFSLPLPDCVFDEGRGEREQPLEEKERGPEKEQGKGRVGYGEERDTLCVDVALMRQHTFNETYYVRNPTFVVLRDRKEGAVEGGKKEVFIVYQSGGSLFSFYTDTDGGGSSSLSIKEALQWRAKRLKERRNEGQKDGKSGKEREGKRLSIALSSFARPQLRARPLHDPMAYVEGVAIHPLGYAISMIIRGEHVNNIFFFFF